MALYSPEEYKKKSKSGDNKPKETNKQPETKKSTEDKKDK